ncbi:SMC family ATPase [Marinitoga sp. 38H-ov]|uniref:AAA family ATPase n=1 Tax=Marinitoga sp. 38H-ov TaxID=1755814 RepID=UPI0013ED8DA2|nr:SMC family ATPase [Marinitoga sp. 38H-ov]KAF2956926.1 hypothetical protein AS160_02770 [Marinitoga sp. 38H-ov]
MKINKIQLRNYRNHRDTTLEFKSGINLLLGKNGAGKSSIFEALGIVLFDVEPRDNNLKNAVSKEEKTATIIVEFTGNDFVDYIVERKIGSQSKYVLRDINGNIISERKNIVLEKIGELAGINGKNTKDIFKNIISAYQNDLVNIFNLTPALRKELFNKIFDTEIYEKIFSSLLSVENEYSKKILADNEKINILSEQLKNYENIEDNIKDIKNNIFNIEKEKNELEEIFSNLENERKAIQKKLDDLKTLNNTLYNEKEKKKILEKNKNTIEKQIIESQKATEIVNNTESGYNEYIEIEHELNNLYMKERELRNKEKELKKIQEDINKKLNNINVLEVEIKNINEKIEESENSINELLSENLKLNNNLIEKTNELNNIINTEKKLLEDFELFKRDYEKYKELERSINDINNKISEEEYLRKILKEKEDELNIFQNSLDDIILKLYEKKEFEFKQKEVILKLENIKKSKEQLQDGICPILNEKCINLEKKGGSTNYFDLNIINLEKEIEFINEKLISLVDLENKKGTLENKINDVKVHIETIKNKLLDIEKIKNQKEEKIIEKNNIEKIYENLYEKKNDFENKKNNIIFKKSKLENELKNLKENIDKNNVEINKLKNNIDDLNKNKESHLLEIKELNSGIHTLTLKEKELSKILVEVESIENNIREKEKKKLLLKEKYEDYIKNKDLAEKLEKFNLDLEKINNEISHISNNILNLNKKVNEYDNIEVLNNELSKIESKISDLHKKSTEISSKLSEYKNELKNLNIKLQEKMEIEKQKNKYELSLKKYELKLTLTKDFRNNIKSMGKYVSSEFTKFISSLATENYRKMTGKNETIIWDSEKDYLVILEDPSKGKREFSILSGGEQVSVAISLRTALANLLSKANLYILDEPTINLDEERRNMLAENLKNMLNEIEQAFIVTHDGTFSEMAENIIEL